MKVAIVGSNGLIGAALARALVARGDSVVALSRSGAAGIGGALDMRWDPAEGPPPPAALDGADAVVNLAGVPIGGKRWTADRKREIRESRTLTTRLIVDALAQEGAPPVLVNGSAVGYYGTTEDTVDETSPAGSDFLAETCVAWEREAIRATEHGVRVVLARTGIVLARDGGALPQMALPVKLFAGGPIGGGRQWIPWIHIDDEVGLLLLALDSPDLSGPLNGSAPEPARQRDFVKALGSALGRPAILPTPAFPLRLAMGEMATLALEGQRAVPAVALAAGYEYVHPELEAALRAIYA
ncbi:MAG: TIGR01777 family oxidoreductase [Thermoleophilia bacterium]|nr:TIGR01777 family oxidoreductase [Thermoleophilia bacterium]